MTKIFLHPRSRQRLYMNASRAVRPFLVGELRQGREPYSTNKKFIVAVSVFVKQQSLPAAIACIVSHAGSIC